MSCERYWTDGAVLAEQDVADAHRETCGDCQRAHHARMELVAALPLVDADQLGDPEWKPKVWQAIERGAPRRAAPWWISGGVVAAAALVLVLWWVRGDRAQPETRPQTEIEIISGHTAMRSKSARVGDSIRVNAAVGEEVRLYRADRLVTQCASSPCETELAVAGEYEVVILTARAPAPTGSLDRDLAAVVSGGGQYRMTELSVR